MSHVAKIASTGRILERALVTGADGFIGSHLVDRLVDSQTEVVAVVRRTSRSQVTKQFDNLVDVRDRAIEVVAVDLAGPDAIDALADCNATAWFHLAADAFVSASLDQPSAVLLNNVLSTSNVLEAARRNPPAHLVIASSSEVYGGSGSAITETAPLHPRTPYAASKVAVDRLASAYWESYRLPLTIVRPFNCYGPRHTYDVVPTFIRNALRGLPLEVFGDGRQTRDLTYVSDTVDGLLAIAEQKGCGEVFNVGTGVDVAIVDIARTVIAISNSSSPIEFLGERAGDLRKLKSDCSKLRLRTGWEPKVEFSAGCRRNLEWAEHEMERGRLW